MQGHWFNCCHVEPGNDQPELAQDHGQAEYAPIVPIIVDEPINTQGNNNGPIIPISDNEQGQAHHEEKQNFAIFPLGDERNNLIVYEE